MNENSPKPSETIIAKVSAANFFVQWLEREGGQQKIPVVLAILAERARRALEKGGEQAGIDAESLRAEYRDRMGGVKPKDSAGRWLQRGQVQKWWAERQRQFRSALHQAGSQFIPDLEIQVGGGRGNPTTYRIAFVGWSGEDADETLTDAVAAGDPTIIHYTRERARMAWWWRKVLGEDAFHMRSWKGMAIVGLAGACVVSLVLIWGAVLLGLNAERPFAAPDVVVLLVAFGLSVAIWKGFRPILRLPGDRITNVSDLFLAGNQMHAQFRLTRDSSRKVGSWFFVERNYAPCPICSADVDLQPGAPNFPGRIVGRCADSPMEHVYSFDPVSLSGRLLIKSSIPVPSDRVV